MTNTIPATETVTIFARDMLTAQGVILTADQRADLVERADRIRRIITVHEGVPCAERQTISVPVRDVYTHVKIGSMAFQNL